MHGQNPATRCAALTFTDALNQRLANGNYTNAMRCSLPVEASQLDGTHLDHLIGYTPAVAAVLTLSGAEDLLVTAMADDSAGVGSFGSMANLAVRFPQHIDEIRRTVNRLLTVCTAPQSAQAGIVLGELSRLEGVTSTASKIITTPAEFKIVNYPQATLFQTIIKNVEKGDSAVDDSRELFDPSTGKKYIPFSKSTKASSDVNLMLGLQIFVITLAGLKKQSPQVYFRLTKEIARVITSHGYKAAHEHLDGILRKLDEGVFPNVVMLFRSGEHNRILQDQDAARGKPEVKARDSKDKEKDPRQRVKFGEVTKPLGGPGAGIINDYKTQAPKLCTRFHAVPQQECSAGVPVGHPSNKAGWCAFKH